MINPFKPHIVEVITKNGEVKYAIRQFGACYNPSTRMIAPVWGYVSLDEVKDPECQVVGLGPRRWRKCSTQFKDYSLGDLQSVSTLLKKIENHEHLRCPKFERIRPLSQEEINRQLCVDKLKNTPEENQ